MNAAERLERLCGQRMRDLVYSRSLLIDDEFVGECWGEVLMVADRAERKGRRWANDDHLQNWAVVLLRRVIRFKRMARYKGRSELREHVRSDLFWEFQGSLNVAAGEEPESLLIDRTREVLASMPKQRAEMLVMRHVWELPAGDISRRHGGSQSNMYWHLKRAEEEFRGRMGGTWKDERKSAPPRRSRVPRSCRRLVAATALAGESKGSSARFQRAPAGGGNGEVEEGPGAAGPSSSGERTALDAA